MWPFFSILLAKPETKGKVYALWYTSRKASLDKSYQNTRLVYTTCIEYVIFSLGYLNQSQTIEKKFCDGLLVLQSYNTTKIGEINTQTPNKKYQTIKVNTLDMLAKKTKMMQHA